MTMVMANASQGLRSVCFFIVVGFKCALTGRTPGYVLEINIGSNAFG